MKVQIDFNQCIVQPSICRPLKVCPGKAILFLIDENIILGAIIEVDEDKYDGCWIGCIMSCSKGVDDFALQTGPYKGQKVIVDGPEYENAADLDQIVEYLIPVIL